jgi:hypothetical protein
LRTVVHAHDLEGIRLERQDLAAVRAQYLHHVRQVDLVLRVVVRYLTQRLGERAGVERVHARIDLADVALFGRRVALLHDALDHAPVTADDPAVPAGVVQRRGEDGRRRAR